MSVKSELKGLQRRQLSGLCLEILEINSLRLSLRSLCSPHGSALMTLTLLVSFVPWWRASLCLGYKSEVVCESLHEDCYRLLQGSNGVRTPEQMFAGGIDRREAEERLEFATGEGMLAAGEVVAKTT